MNRLIILCMAAFLCACGESKKKNYLEEGWNAFAQGDYAQALLELQTAKLKNPNDSKIRTALGWTYMRLDSLEPADMEFAEGSVLSEAPVDLAAGWSFVLAANHNYAASNIQAAQALTVDPDWVFLYADGIDHHDIRVVKAENHFLLGEFALSLNEIQILNSDFNADINTATGRSQLASEIERLRSLNKSMPLGKP